MCVQEGEHIFCVCCVFFVSFLDAVKQEAARVNTDILGISELKWTGMGEFNSDDHYILWARIP